MDRFVFLPLKVWLLHLSTALRPTEWAGGGLSLSQSGRELWSLQVIFTSQIVSLWKDF